MTFWCTVCYIGAICSVFLGANSGVIVTVDATTTCTNSGNADVVIVGAGVSGIAAYNQLKTRQPRLNVVVLEATNRVGGRMKQLSFGGTTVELGPNWLSVKGTTIR
jgi:monoamine oxidase